MVSLGLVFVFVLVMIGSPLQAPQQDAPCQAEPYRAFDFWLGTWDVRDADGNSVGRNIVTAEEEGCLILERWTSSTGGTGQSYNFYDPVSDTWRQVWVSSAALIDYDGNLNADGEMVLSGTITYQQTGQTADFTGSWRLRDDGVVVQHFEQYDAENSVWNDWFTGFYHPIDRGEEQSDATP